MVLWPKEAVVIMLETSKSHQARTESENMTSRKIYDNYELWSEYTFRTEQELSVGEIAYWSSFHRWPLVVAVYLSMGQIPFHRPPSGKLKEFGKRPTDPNQVNQLEDFENRLNLAKLAAESGELVIEKIPDTRGMGHPYVERLVPVGDFIHWARKTYPINYEPLFQRVLSTFKSPKHAASGGHKGKQADEVKKKITDIAIKVLEDGCRCHNPDLGHFLYIQNIKDLKGSNSDDKFVIVLPGIDDNCYESHFKEAVNDAFDKMGIPLRNQPKTPGAPKRGKRYCDRPGHKS